MSDNGNRTRGPEPVAEVYPSAPLKAVAMEFYFAHLLDAQARFGNFQRRHAAVFPRVMMKDDDDPQGAILLLEESKERGVAISPTMFSIVTYRYGDGFEGFRKWAAPILEEVLQLLDIPSLTSIAYRYENVINVEGGTTAFDVVAFQLPKAGDQRPLGRDLFMSWKQPWAAGDVTIDLGAYNDHMHLDISARCRGPLPPGAALDAACEAHRAARHTFEALITPSFRDRLRRKPS